RIGREDLLGDVDLHRVQRPGAHAAEQIGVAELVLAGDGVLDVAERTVERQDSGRRAGVDHAGDRVVPQVLLVAGALGSVGRAVVTLRRVLADQVAGVAAADAGGLHPTARRQVGRTERQALHARRGVADL